MNDFTLSDHLRSEGFQSKLFVNVKKLTNILGILGFLGAFLISFGAYSQVIVEGAVPVQTPLGGFGLDGDAKAGTPDPTYNLVGDWFFEDYDDPNNTNPGGIFRRDPINGTLNPIYDNTFFLQDDVPMGNVKDATIFTTAAKIDQDPNTYTWGEGSSPNKNEIQNVAVHFAYGDDGMLDSFGNPGDPDELWALFAADREVTNGDSYIDFEFLQASLTMTGLEAGYGGFESGASAATGGRTVGDLLVTVGYGNGGGVATVAILRWESDGSGGYHYDLKDIEDYEGLIYATTNTNITNVPFDAYGKDYYEINQWVEGAVNLSGIFETNLDPCISLSTLFVRTRSSGESGTAQLKDFPEGPIQLEIDLTPPAPEVTDVENCSPWEGSLTATGCEGTVKWYAAETGGSPLYTGATYTPASPITETTSFWVSCTVDGCEGPRAEVTVTIYEIPDFDVTNLEACEEGETGAATFDLNDAISNEDTGTLTFYATEGDALVPENAIDPIDVSVLLTDSPETFWARLDNDNDGDEDCHTIKSFTVTVYDNPDLTVTDLEDCEATDTGAQTFDLNFAITEDDDGTISFYESMAEANAGTPAIATPGAYSVDIGTTTLWARSDNDSDNEEGCYSIASFDVTVYDNPDISTTNPDPICEGDSIDLSMYVTNPDGGVLTYHTSMNDADTDMGALMNSMVTPGLGETIYWVRSEITNGEYVCYNIDSITVTVETCIIDQGCTLGYWKNHTDDWCQNTYTIGTEEVTIATCTLYGNVFENAPSHIAGLTLYQAISLEGNSNSENLARQSVAALLNTCSSAVGFAYSSVYTLIEDVNLAWSGDSQTEKSFAMDLDYMNNANCPLGGSANTEPSSSCINGAEASIEESSFRTMTTEEETVDFRVYPLPFTANLSVQYEFGYTSDVTLEFYNITGQLLRTYEDKQVTNGDVTELTLDFATQANQIYILRVITDRDVFFKKILSGN